MENPNANACRTVGTELFLNGFSSFPIRAQTNLIQSSERIARYKICRLSAVPMTWGVDIFLAGRIQFGRTKAEGHWL
jgi:hypothetical protein